MAVTIYRVVDLGPPHATQEYAAPTPRVALELFGIDPTDTTEEVLSTRVTQFSLPGIAWLVVALRTQE